MTLLDSPLQLQANHLVLGRLIRPMTESRSLSNPAEPINVRLVPIRDQVASQKVRTHFQYDSKDNKYSVIIQFLPSLALNALRRRVNSLTTNQNETAIMRKCI